MGSLLNSLKALLSLGRRLEEAIERSEMSAVEELLSERAAAIRELSLGEELDEPTLKVVERVWEQNRELLELVQAKLDILRHYGGSRVRAQARFLDLHM